MAAEVKTMGKVSTGLAALGLLLPTVTLGLDPGVARGVLTVEGEQVQLAHAYAWRHDNTEGLLDGAQLRILVTDREVSEYLLAGAMPLAVERMARDGRVRGVLLKLSADPPREAVNGTVLFPVASPELSLPSFVEATAQSGLRRLDLGDRRVVGAADYESHAPPRPDAGVAYAYSLEFNAPVFQDPPVSADLKGKAARTSAPARAFLAYEAALRAGDMSRVRQLLTPERYEEVQAFAARLGPSRFAEQAAGNLPPEKTRARQIKRVVVRGDRATVIFSQAGTRGFQALIQNADGWKVD
jgi:hypothetical protein